MPTLALLLAIASAVLAGFGARSLGGLQRQTRQLLDAMLGPMAKAWATGELR